MNGKKHIHEGNTLGGLHLNSSLIDKQHDNSDEIPKNFTPDEMDTIKKNQKEEKEAIQQQTDIDTTTTMVAGSTEEIIDVSHRDATVEDATVEEMLVEPAESNSDSRGNQTQQREDGAQSPVETLRPVMRSKRSHPGLTEFHNWMDAIASIYRMYSIGKVNKSDEPVIPLLPRSERGRVSLNMVIENRTSRDIDVFWIDYKGKEIKKGSLSAFSENVDITITTWIGHPWAFRDRHSGMLLLYYVPYRIIPFTESNHPDTAQETRIGRHRFILTSPMNDEDACAVIDHVFTNITSIDDAVAFSIQQMERENVSPMILLKYLYNIALNPNDSKYRQIRTSNKVFFNNVWCNGGRGVLHALGFEENQSHIEMGPSEGPLTGERIKQVTDAVMMLEKYLNQIEGSPRRNQPVGSDGSGRANWR
ncbi:hypothetical protein CTEN210_02275 [Chaetoceros tenuissimus]|uniref:Uncharacterized protein n=1 Tax=Chaetoceros tenuissimus TaxID=426638 RepID=A0AAD3CJ53_9STRA|nr:hypothetical protein CTEN210_02275 [Chaetoceros tenuissimus]